MKKIILCMLFLFCITTYSQDFDKGKELFNANCAACHNMERKMTGPALKDVIKNQGREWTSTWIKNSANLIASGDTHANEVYKEYNEMAMPAYEYLPADELAAIVDYLELYTEKKEAQIVAASVTVSAETSTSQVNQQIPTYLIVILILIMLVVIISTFLISKALKLLFLNFDNTKMINEHLMKKLNISKDDVSKEVKFLVENEVEKRVNNKVKSLKNILNIKLKEFK